MKNKKLRNEGLRTLQIDHETYIKFMKIRLDLMTPEGKLPTMSQTLSTIIKRSDTL